MKSCPVCKRTFDDSLTFCLEDGSLLSAPLDPPPGVPAPTEPVINVHQPAVVPARPDDNVPEQETVVRHGMGNPASLSKIPSRKPLAYVGIAGGALLLIVLGYFGFQQLSGGGSPTAAMRASSEAIKKKDVEGVKKFFSPVQLSVWKDAAKAEGLSLDEYLKKELDRGGYDSFIVEEIRNERISGDLATVEVKVHGQWIQITMEKINGVWQYLG